LALGAPSLKLEGISESRPLASCPSALGTPAEASRTVWNTMAKSTSPSRSSSPAQVAEHAFTGGRMLRRARSSAVNHSQSGPKLFIFSVTRQLRHGAQPFLRSAALVSFGTRRTALPHRMRAVGVLQQHQLQASRFRNAKPAAAAHRTAPPNPSLKRTRNGMRRMAFISFWAMRRMPLRAA
jgi:hypothetical protein